MRFYSIFIEKTCRGNKHFINDKLTGSLYFGDMKDYKGYDNQLDADARVLELNQQKISTDFIAILNAL